MTDGDRLPELTSDEMTEAQRQVIAEIASGPRGVAVGPFVPLSRSPELMRRVQRTGEYLRFDSPLDRRLFELCVLMVARFWDQQFEWGYHLPLALRAGLAQDAADAVAQGRRPDGMDQGARAVWELVTELLETHAVSDDVYERAVMQLGEIGVIDLVATAGYYATLAMVMNTACTPPADGPRLPLRQSTEESS